MFRRNLCLDRLSRVVLRHAWRQHEIDAEWTVTHKTADLSQLLRNFFRETSSSTIDTESTGVGNSCYGFNIVGETKDRTIDPEAVHIGLQIALTLASKMTGVCQRRIITGP